MDSHLCNAATRDIKKGEELYLDYGNDYWQDVQADDLLAAQLPLPVSPRIPPSNKPCPSPTETTGTMSPIRRASETPQRAPPLTGILLLHPPSPWTPTMTPPRISGHHNPHTHHTHDILKDTHSHNHTLFLNDTLVLNEHSHSHALILNDTTILNDTCHS